VADKLTQQITDALTRAAAEPGGLALYASKADPGLFPNTAAAKPAAQKCFADELVRVVATDAKGKSPRELYALTEKGWEFLLAAVNPKQVLEDFVRVLEARQGEVGELLDTARSMANSLQGLKEAVTRVLPGVTSQRVQRPRSAEPTPPGPPSLKGRGEKDLMDSIASSVVEEATSSVTPLPFREGGMGGLGSSAGTDLLSETSLAPAVVAYLAERSTATDCPLPELFRAVARTAALTIGEFHDCLRQLYADGKLTLPAWTGPLYALPEPQYALLIGHGIAYYASLRG
jgi:hypothetical protein